MGGLCSKPESAMTKITLEIPAVVTFNIARLEKGIECDLSKAANPHEAAMIIFAYGLRRYINDATGGADLSDEDRMSAAQDKIDRLLSGEARTGGGGPRLAPWVPVFRKTVVAFLLAQKLCKREEAEKTAALSPAAIAGKIVEFKPQWSLEKVQARVDTWSEEAKRLAQVDSTDDLI